MCVCVWMWLWFICVNRAALASSLSIVARYCAIAFAGFGSFGVLSLARQAHHRQLIGWSNIGCWDGKLELVVKMQLLTFALICMLCFCGPIFLIVAFPFHRTWHFWENSSVLFSFYFCVCFGFFFSFVVHNSIADQRSSILCKLITAVTNTNKLHKHITVIDIDFEIQIRLGIKIEININETDTARQFVLFDKRAKFV